MSETPIIDTAAEDSNAQRRKRRRAVVIGGLSLAFVLTLALTGTSPFWAPPLAQVLPWGQKPNNAMWQALADHLATVESEVKSLRDAQSANAQIVVRLNALEKRFRQTSPDVGQFAADLQQLNQTMQSVQSTTADNAQRIATLQSRLARSGDNPDRLLFLALGQLSVAAATSRTFVGELKAAEALAPSEIKTRLLTLDPVAVTGIPSTAVLAARFDAEVGPAMLRATPLPAVNESWTKRFWAKLKSLVVIHRVGRDGTPPDATVAAIDSARGDLAQDDLAGAVSAVEAAPAPAHAAAQSWLKTAHQRLDAEATIAAAMQDVTTALAAPAATSSAKPVSPSP